MKMAKKHLGLLVAFCLLMVAVPAAGESAAAGDVPVEKKIEIGIDPSKPVTKEIDPDKITAPDRPKNLDAFAKNEIQAGDMTKAVTSDTVLINGDSYMVILKNGPTFTYSVPDNGVYVFTQDLAQQSSLFNKFCKNPKETADSFISDGMHFDIYDDINNIDLYLFVYTSDLSNVFVDTNDMTVNEIEYVINYMFTQDAYFAKCSSADYGWMGGNVWMLADGRSTGNGVLMCAFVGGLEIWGIANITTDDQYNRLISLMQNLTVR